MIYCATAGGRFKVGYDPQHYILNIGFHSCKHGEARGGRGREEEERKKLTDINFFGQFQNPILFQMHQLLEQNKPVR